jgi:hypothetical protein
MFDEMPEYICHKVVKADQITQIIFHEGGDASIFLKNTSGAYHLPKTFIDRHHPVVGSYIVYYEDGYFSVSPAEPFEKGYSLK